MANTIIKPADRQAWLKERGNGIGSSEVGAIMGLSQYETPYSVWLRKTGRVAPKQENFLMRAGHYLEDAVSKFYADETGVDIIKASAGDWLIVDNERPFMRVSPDRIFWLPNMPHTKANKGIVECKTTQRSVDADSVPLTWYAQLQYQLGVAGFTNGALAWLTAGRDFGYINVEFDPEFYAMIVEAVSDFWYNYVQADQEPEPINASDAVAMYPKHIQGKSVQADGETLAKYNELKVIKQQIKTLDERKVELENDLKFCIGDAEMLVTEEGSVISTFKASKDSRKFDEKLFAAEHPDEYEKYMRVVTGSRRFLLK